MDEPRAAGGGAGAASGGAARVRVPSTRGRVLAWLLAAVFIPGGFFAIVQAIDRAAPDVSAWAVLAAFRATDPGDPPAPGTTWDPVRVPHHRIETGSAPKVAWYRLVPPARIDAREAALFVPEPDGAVELHAGGLRIADVSSDETPLPYHEFPLLLRVPGDVLRAAAGDVRVRVVRDGRYSHVPGMYLGPVDALEPVARHAWWARAGAARAAMVAALCVMGLAFAFFALRRTETAYGWFGATLLTLVAHVAHDHVVAVPVPRALWLASTTAWLAVFAYCAIVFVHRFLGFDARRVERIALVAYGASAAVMLAHALVLGWTWHGVLIRTVVPLVLVGGAYMLFRLGQAAWRSRTFETHALLAAAGTTLAMGLRDFLVDTQLLAGSVYYLGYALLFLVLTFGSVIVRRFVRTVADVETLSRELESRVVATTARIEADYARLRALELGQAGRAERARMVREMNDGIGAQLRAGLDVARAGRGDAARAALERCLADLRLLVDAADAADGDLLGLLARFRHRVERGLAAAGVELDWQVTDLPPRPLASEESLAVLRILQAALGGLAGDGARTLAVRTGVDAGNRVWLELATDGAWTLADDARRAADDIRAALDVRDGALRVTLRGTS